jgi:HAMP domain-containing protein
VDPRIGSLEESLSLALGYLPDIRLHGSLVLCALVIVWLAAIHRRASKQPLTRGHRRKTMTRTAHTPAGSAGRPATPSATGFHIKWDRTVLAAVVLLATLTFLVTGIAAVVGAATGTAALVAALLAIGGLTALRALALRDRKKRKDHRIEQAFAEAMNPGTPTTPGTPADPVRPARLFDAAAGRGQAPSTPAAAAQPATPSPAEQPVPAAPTVPPSGTDAPDAAAVPSVPRPTYLDAAEAERPVPAPLEVPQTPKPTPGTKLKSGVSAEYQAQVSATAHRALDLDKVLERRRAI